MTAEQVARGIREARRRDRGRGRSGRRRCAAHAAADRSAAQDRQPHRGAAWPAARTTRSRIVAGISRELEQKGLNAGEWIRSAAEVVGGRGGGRPDMAQAGGKHPEKLPAALDAAKARIKELLGN